MIKKAILSYVPPNGRIDRGVYFVASLVIPLMLGIVCAILDALFMSSVFTVLAILVTTVLSTFSGIKRCHDLGKSGWYMLFWLLPIANLVLVAFLLFAPGENKTNIYGDAP